MPRRSLALISLTLALALPGVARAQAPALSIATAKALVAQQADKVKRDMADDGAQKASVPGCWRNGDRRVSCYLMVKGYDAADDFHWTCMLRAVVERRRHPAPGEGAYRVTYGQAVCG